MAARTRKWVASAHYKASVLLLLEARKSAGLTQRELAKLLGKVPSWVAKVEQLERRIDVLEFTAIARALDQDELKLFGKFLKQLPKRIEI